ncbi:MAG TPA: type VI secretion system contractile sheath small subunit [Chitinispirillaceae bacterium]|jgi:type VI secretion system protein ImpB|nr:type VI secretion system contractile sheath small subunit [Chitinispirillaceae bacterium]
MSGSFQNEIPAARINLKLDVGRGDARKKIELPLKFLVMGDFTGKKKEKRISERERISINKENFGQVMESMNLSLELTVENKLSGQGELRVDLDIKDMDSFKPENVARNIPALSRLLAARNLLKDLKSNLLDNREFRKRLEEILRAPASARLLQAQLKKIVPEAQEQPA